MALQIAKDTPYGVAAGYWRIIVGQIDYTSQTLIVTMAGYLDANTRGVGKTPLMQQRIIFGGVEATAPPFIADPSRASIYAAIKSLPDWAGAIDI